MNSTIAVTATFTPNTPPATPGSQWNGNIIISSSSGGIQIQ
jgi:hypothetical protein